MLHENNDSNRVNWTGQTRNVSPRAKPSARSAFAWRIGRRRAISLGRARAMPPACVRRDAANKLAKKKSDERSCEHTRCASRCAGSGPSELQDDYFRLISGRTILCALEERALQLKEAADCSQLISRLARAVGFTDSVRQDFGADRRQQQQQPPPLPMEALMVCPLADSRFSIFSPRRGNHISPTINRRSRRSSFSIISKAAAVAHASRRPL